MSFTAHTVCQLIQSHTCASRKWSDKSCLRVFKATTLIALRNIQNDPCLICRWAGARHRVPEHGPTPLAKIRNRIINNTEQEPGKSPAN